MEPVASTIGEASNYDQLIEVYRKRMAQLGLTFEVLDYLSGLQAGYSNKLLGPSQSKTIGQVSMALLNKTLALKFVAIEDLEAAAEMGPRWERRDRPPNKDAGRPARLGKATLARVFLPVVIEMGKRGRAKQLAVQKPSTRRRIARLAAKARWHPEARS